MHVDVIDSFDELLRLRGNWDAVYDADPEAQFFISWTWISGWFKRLRYQWLVLAVKEEPNSSAYAGFFPLQLRTERAKDGKFRNELRTGGGYFSGYNGFICNPDLRNEVIRAFADHIKRFNWAKLHLENIAVSPEQLGLFLNEFPSSEFAVGKVKRPDDGDGIDHDIYVHVPLPGDWEAFLSERLGAKTRANARRTLRQVDSPGEYRISDVSAASLERDLQTLLQFWENQWAAKLAARYNPGLPKAMMANFRDMLSYCFQHDALFLPVLWQGETPIGVQASLIDKKNGSLISLLNGRDLSIKRPPPGFALHLFSIRWAIENGFKIYDLQTGDFPYKYDFGGIERRIEYLQVSTNDRRNIGHRLDRRSLPVVFAQTRALYHADRLAEAALGCREILETDPEHKGSLQLLEQIDAKQQPALLRDFNAAAQLQKAGQLAEAEAIYRTILEAEPTHFAAANRLGMVFLQQHKYDAAERQFSFAISLKPDAPAAHYNRGFARLGLERLEEALASFDAALALKPEDVRIIAIRDNVLEALRRNPAPSGVSKNARGEDSIS